MDIAHSSHSESVSGYVSVAGPKLCGHPRLDNIEPCATPRSPADVDTAATRVTQVSRAQTVLRLVDWLGGPSLSAYRQYQARPSIRGTSFIDTLVED